MAWAETAPIGAPPLGSGLGRDRMPASVDGRVTHPLFDVIGRVAVVTGSSRGIGRALARGLFEAGCIVVSTGVTKSSRVPGSPPTRRARAPQDADEGRVRHWAAAGLQVNGLGPGYIETELTRSLVEDASGRSWIRTRDLFLIREAL